MEQIDDEFLREWFAWLDLVEVDGINPLGFGGLTLPVVTLDDRDAIVLDARCFGDTDSVRLQRIYKCAGQPLSGLRVEPLHAQRLGRVVRYGAFENGHEGASVARQVHRFETTGTIQSRLAATR